MEDWMNGNGRNDGRSDVNKIRRGPGRRLAKEKRFRQMDSAILQKYASLPPVLQEKVNAAIEICYQQHMASIYKAQRNPSTGNTQGRAAYPPRVTDQDEELSFDSESGY